MQAQVFQAERICAAIAVPCSVRRDSTGAQGRPRRSGSWASSSVRGAAGRENGQQHAEVERKRWRDSTGAQGRRSGSWASSSVRGAAGRENGQQHAEVEGKRVGLTWDCHRRDGVTSVRGAAGCCCPRGHPLASHPPVLKPHPPPHLSLHAIP
jgi:hypothetical protein